MKRRDFVKTILAAGALAGSYQAGAWNGSVNKSTVIVKNGNSRQRYLKGIQNFGGLENFIGKGKRVALKPTMAFNRLPDSGFNSDPDLIKELIENCFDAGARVVSVFDHTIDAWTKCYKNSGIERIAKDGFARVIPANNEMYYKTVSLDKAQNLKQVKIHKAVLEADVFINVAAGRFENEGNFFGAVENLSGCVWERDEITAFGNDQKLAELLYYLKPDLNILDMEGAQVISTGSATADEITLQYKGISSQQPKYLTLARKLGLGGEELRLDEITLLPVDKI